MQLSTPLLIYPPFADPTWPYVSLPTIKGYLQSKKINISIQDFNAEMLTYLTSKKTILEWKGTLQKRARQLNKKQTSKTKISMFEKLEYHRILQAIPLCELDFSAALSLLKSGQAFYEKQNYLKQRDRLEVLFQIMEATFFPFRFSFNRADHLVAPWDFELLGHYISHKKSPLDLWYQQKLAQIPANQQFIGISLTFISQLPETFYLAKLIKKQLPNCFIMLGGATADLVAHELTAHEARKLFTYVDAFCLQEGEESLAQLLPLIATHGGRPTDYELEKIPNIFFASNSDQTILHGPCKVFDLKTSTAPPDYSDLDLSNYLAPSPMLLYAPTRGCYWNRCSFCGYGFNQSGKHRYREIPIEQAAADLQSMQKNFATSNFYFSCDVLSPKYALALAAELIKRKIKIFWSTDLRIEANYTLKNCQLLYKSGLRAVAFGVESGSEKILQLMDKGITPHLIEKINANFHQAGISTAWMTFLNHPQENLQDIKKTIKILADNHKQIDQFIVGNFNPTPRSPIACNPTKFGVEKIYYTQGDIFHLFPLHIAANDSLSLDDKAQQLIDKKIDQLSSQNHLDHYPWAGAISTHHSFLYILKYGQRIFAAKWPKLKNSRAHFSTQKISDSEEQWDYLLANYLQGALRPSDYIRDKVPTALHSFRYFMRWQ